MRYWPVKLLLADVALLVLGGCPLTTQQRNPFLGYTDEFGVAGQQEVTPTGQGGGAAAAETFRRPLALSFRNNHRTGDLNVSFVAWVEVNSIRSADQQDVLLAAGYTQLTHSVDLGTAFTLPIGTFVFDGGGTAGATALVLGPAQAAADTNAAPTPTEFAVSLPTPDAILAYIEPPVSCESVAFYFSQQGEPLTSIGFGAAPGEEEQSGSIGGGGIFGGSTSSGPFKTMAQIDVYDCDPFHPGVFFSRSGAGRAPNEYLEGENVVFDFFEFPDTNGYFGHVTIGASQTSTGGG